MQKLKKNVRSSQKQKDFDQVLHYQYTVLDFKNGKEEKEDLLHCSRKGETNVKKMSNIN